MIFVIKGFFFIGIRFLLPILSEVEQHVEEKPERIALNVDIDMRIYTGQNDRL